MLKMSTVNQTTIPMAGGLDQITPTLSLTAGAVRDAVNFECLEFGGYGRIGGYERFSGQTSPTTASFTAVYVSAYVTTPTVGQTLTNAGATASGLVIAVESSYIIVTKATGTFFAGDTLKVGASTVGIVVNPTSALASLSVATYNGLAADIYRADILPPTGSGAILGGFIYNDLVYCIRNNTGGTASNLWKQSTSGWVQIAFNNEVKFTGGNVAAPADGAILTQGGVTATLKRAVKTSGLWSGTAVGSLIITTPSGGNFVAGAATLTGGTTVVLSGAQTAITLLPNGKGESVEANFSGQLSATRIYYADGVNRMFEFDGTTLIPISTASVPDKPKHIVAFKNNLFFSVQSSIFSQGLGNPYSSSSTDGAVEIACGDTITGFLIQPGSQTSATLSVHGAQTTFILYGTSSANWNLITYNSGVGALDYSVQNLSQSYSFDNRGVFALTPSLNYGNFDSATITNLIRPFVAEKRTKVSCSSLDRSKSQYRLFFNDGSGLYITIVNGTPVGCMPIMLNTAANVAFEGSLSTGQLVKFIGGADGHVHQLDVGTSFDGASINAYLTLNWANFGNARILKRFRRASFEVSGNGYAAFSFGYSLGYGNIEIQQPLSTNYETPFSPAYWDNFYWDNFYWDGKTLVTTECEMVGTGENVQITLASNSNLYQSFAINSMTIHHSQRRGIR